MDIRVRTSNRLGIATGELENPSQNQALSMPVVVAYIASEIEVVVCC